MNSTCVELCSKGTRAEGHVSLEVEVKDELNAKIDYPSDQNDDIGSTTQTETDQIAIKVICQSKRKKHILACFSV